MTFQFHLASLMILGRWLALSIFPALASANGIATDGTMGAAQSLSGANVTIPQSLGTTSGNNLFHSFSEFNINSGQTVSYTGSNALQNVISRVTGPDATSINGILQSLIPNAAFFFINPHGITFGQGAQIDVPGAFHVSTANKIEFQNNGGSFYADSSQVSTLSNQTPASLGFLATNTANNGLIDINAAQLTAKTGQTFDVTANRISLENASITAAGGDIRLAAIQGNNSMSLQANADGSLPVPPVSPDAANAGNITLNLSTVSANGNSGGRVSLWGNNLAVDNSVVSAWTLGSGNAGSIDVNANTLTVDGQGNTLTANGIFSDAKVGSSGTAGTVTIQSKILNVLNSAVVSATTFSSGNGGTVNVMVDTLNISNGGQLITSTFENGHAGGVDLDATTLHIDGQGNSATGIFAQSGSRGFAGTITINAGNMDIVNAGQLSTSTSGLGKAGEIDVTASNLAIEGLGHHAPLTGIFSMAFSGSSGQTGNINLTIADSLQLHNGAQISIANQATLADAVASSITPGNLNISATDILMQDSTISSSSLGNITAGSIAINFSHNLLMDPSFITATAVNGNGGSINISGGELVFLQNSGISTTVTGATSNGGNIFLSSTLLLLDNSMFLASAMQGKGGNIILNPQALISGQPILVVGAHQFNWQPYAGYNVIGVNGTLTLTAPQLNLSGVLANMGSAQFDDTILSQDYCNVGKGSSLTRMGQGGLPPKAGNLMIY